MDLDQILAHLRELRELQMEQDERIKERAARMADLAADADEPVIELLAAVVESQMIQSQRQEEFNQGVLELLHAIIQDQRPE